MTLALSLIASCQGFSVGAGGTLTVTAPAIVHCDATGSISNVTPTPSIFGQQGHLFDFGDTSPSGSGHWSYPVDAPIEQRQKNQFVGRGLTAHLYEYPGSYTLQHKARDTDGQETESTPITINVVASGYPTVCLYRASGLGQGTEPKPGVTWHNVDTGWPNFSSNTEYLLRAGEDFTSAGNLDLGGGIHELNFAKYETGSDPRVGQVWVGYNSPNTMAETDWPSNIRFSDLDVERLNLRNVTFSVAFIRGQIREGYYIASSINYWLGQVSSQVAAEFRFNSFAALVDTHVVTNNSSQKSTVFGNAYAPIFLGCRIGTPTLHSGDEHSQRMFTSIHGVYQYCQYDRPAADGGRCWLRIQSNGTDPIDLDTYTSNESSPYNSVEYIDFVNTPAAGVRYAFWGAPENGSSVQAVSDLAIGNCYFTGWESASGISAEIAVGAENVVYGGNTYSRSPNITTGWKINGGLTSGPYLNETFEIPSEFESSPGNNFLARIRQSLEGNLERGSWILN